MGPHVLQQILTADIEAIILRLLHIAELLVICPFLISSLIAALFPKSKKECREEGQASTKEGNGCREIEIRVLLIQAGEASSPRSQGLDHTSVGSDPRRAQVSCAVSRTLQAGTSESTQSGSLSFGDDCENAYHGVFE